MVRGNYFTLHNYEDNHRTMNRGRHHCTVTIPFPVLQEMVSVLGVQVLELQECGVQLEQCQLVRYNELTGTLGNTFDEPKVGADWLRLW